MSVSLPQIVDALAGQDVLVVGECILDRYLQGATNRLCPEAPVPVVELSSRLDQPGGAANAACNARRLGARVSFLSVVGDDAEGEAVLHGLQRRDINISHVLIQPERRTLTRQRVLAGSQLLVRVDHGDTDPVAPGIEARLIERLIHKPADAVRFVERGDPPTHPGDSSPP
jgi:D-beta-D-heptose 7-phosphate kinase/D-beta-D-heptose 1-phosphate adenosyltransferase